MEETTNSWSSRRKAIYFWSTILVLTGVSCLIFWKFWYKSPTCFDRLPNGDETGVDCGGSCSLVCSAEATPPIMRGDPRIFQVYPNVYSLLAFVENQNIDSEAKSVPYRFQVFDADGNLIAGRAGNVYLPRNRTTAVFEGGVSATSSKPSKVTFTLSKDIAWTKNIEPTPPIIITHSPLLNADKQPSIQAKVENKSTSAQKNLEIVAVILDGRDNAIAASRTFIDLLKPGAAEDVFFTWPTAFDLKETVCEKPSDTVLVLDRSGSIASALPTVKSSALDFISQLKDGDRAALVSFATDATIDNELTEDFSLLSSSTKAISIKKDGTQYTNIADALKVSAGILTARNSSNSNQIIILLTDGVATKGGKNDTAEVENEALTQSNEAKKGGIEIFTIGLGKEIHENFLKQLTSSSTNYFFAPTAGDLKKIYQNISSSICQETPARIEILSKILGS